MAHTTHGPSGIGLFLLLTLLFSSVFYALVTRLGSPAAPW